MLIESAAFHLFILRNVCVHEMLVQPSGSMRLCVTQEVGTMRHHPTYMAITHTCKLSSLKYNCSAVHDFTIYERQTEQNLTNMAE